MLDVWCLGRAGLSWLAAPLTHRQYLCHFGFHLDERLSFIYTFIRCAFFTCLFSSAGRGIFPPCPLNETTLFRGYFSRLGPLWWRCSHVAYSVFLSGVARLFILDFRSSGDPSTTVPLNIRQVGSERLHRLQGCPPFLCLCLCLA